ncbi:hypothetical protein BASA81_003026 [Batrachochytrium salamandrivorans]|nr:hypothetical protein BASA81_003026 [Batrachochytrium salamandrivorans]
MRLLLAVLPLLGYCLLLQTGLFTTDKPPTKNFKERKWLFRVLTAFLLTLQIGKQGLNTWWGMIVLVISQLLLIKVTDFSESSLHLISRMLIPSQVGLILMQSAEESNFARTTVLAFAIRTVAALFVTPTTLEHLCQLLVIIPSVVLSHWHAVDEAFLTRLALMTSTSSLVPIALDDVTQTLVQWNDKLFTGIVPRAEQEILAVPIKARWAVVGLGTVLAAMALHVVFEANSLPYYDLLWNMLAGCLLLISCFTWGMSYANSTTTSTTATTTAATALRPQPSNSTLASPLPPPRSSSSGGTAPSSPNSNNGHRDHDQVGFMQRAQQEDLLTFQACLSFIHMLIVLFMTSIDLPHLAFVNLIIIASLLFQNHNPQSLHELVSGVVVSQSLSLFVLRYQLQDALAAARLTDPNAQLIGVDAVAEQVGLVFCSIRLVAGAILTENFSRHAAETLLLAGVSIYCCSGYSTKYLCLVMMGMSIFASRIKASTVSLAISWLNSEYELRRFMDHELRVSFAGIMLALEHCLQSEKDEARLPEDTIQMLNDALAECKRGKELCFQATMQRLAYDNAYELQIEGKTLDDGIQQNYHNVVTNITAEEPLQHCIVHTDWNLINHVLDNAVANGSKYGTNVIMESAIDINGEEEAEGFVPAMLKLKVTNIPLQNERYQALLQMDDNSELFEYTPADNEEKKVGGNNLWSLGGPSGGRNSSTHIGLPVAKVFANRLNGMVKLVVEPTLATFLLHVPVMLSPPDNHPYHSNSQSFFSAIRSHTAQASSCALAPSGTESASPSLSLPNEGSVHSVTSEDLDVGMIGGNGRRGGPKGGGDGNNSSSTVSTTSAMDTSEIPAGLVFASLDDSAMIRSTFECMLYREFKASPLSIVRGFTAEEAASFAKQVVDLQADICIIDENLDYDENTFVGTNVVKELRNLGYDGVVILYSANEKLGTKLNLELVDGFASKSATRLETKQLLAGIYWNRKAKKKFTSNLSKRVFVSPEVKSTIFSPTQSKFSALKHRIHIANVDNIQAADEARSKDPSVITVGIVKEEGVFAYSPFVRFAHVRRRDIEIPLLMSTKVDRKYIPLFAKFDVVCSASQLDKCDFPLLVGLGLDHQRFTARGSVLDQEMNGEVLLDFGPPDAQVAMLDSMNQGINEGLDRIHKKPTTESVRKIAHMIKGSSVQIGARALHLCASKLEKSCMEDSQCTSEENWSLYCQFILLLLDFLNVSHTLAVEA